MTDAEVKINGRLAGAKHQGAFYAFKYDISGLLKYGKENLLEVKVDKHSSNRSVNAAEREADYWIFGGIFRPVWLEVLPLTHISDIAIDAKANGQFRTFFKAENIDRVEIKFYDRQDRLVHTYNQATPGNKELKIHHILTSVNHPKTWTSETPHLYRAEYVIYRNDKPVHTVSKKFGFRTIEVKQRDGIYVNGKKMKFKGVNRHSFQAESGRTTSYKK